MDSEDDLLNAHDMESGEEEEDDFYSGGTEDYYNESDGDDEPDYGFVEEDDVDDSVMIASHRSQVGSLRKRHFSLFVCLGFVLLWDN